MAETKAGLKGLNTVLKNLNKEVKKIKGRSMKGLIRSAIIIRRDMDFTPPLIPVDLGNLRASWFVITSGGNIPRGKSPIFKGEVADVMMADHSNSLSSNASKIRAANAIALIMGFSAFYSVFVHENYGAHFQRPQSGAGFFKASINNNSRKVLEMIAHEARIR